jgi:hypothetical protein
LARSITSGSRHSISAAKQGAVSPGCTGSFADLRRDAQETRQAVIAADDAARRADVYPGTRRDIRRRSRLDALIR